VIGGMGVGGVPVLVYHWFRPRPGLDGDSGRSATGQPGGASRWEMGADKFARQMQYLVDRGYRGVSLATAMKHDASRSRIVALTFDDGTRDFWDHARPCLQEFGFRGTLFVVTGRVGTVSSWDQDVGESPRPLMNWDRLVRLQRNGFEIASHTHTHRVLPSLSDHEAAHELVESRRVLAARIGTAPDLLAYPRGARTERDRELAREAGYRAACTVILRWRDVTGWPRANGVQRTQDRALLPELPRMPVKGNESMGRFRARLALARRAGLRPGLGLPD